MSSYRHLLCFLIGSFTESFLAAEVDFDRDIRPLLSDTCFQCHGPDAVQREADLRLDTKEGLFGDLDGFKVVAPGDAEASELFFRIAHEDSEERMPPPDAKRKLKPQEIKLIEQWIEGGAEWEQHWSLVPPKRPDIPAVSNSDWVRNPIDSFILARLDAENLQPSPPANERILGRRIHFDITGLPPTAEQMERFLDLGVEGSLDQLFQSESYGEKMAMRWLDASRYADTSGYQNDGWREMWRWRDWVIDAYNANMPFDQFTVEQLAGDLLPNPSLEQMIATGFNRNHRGNAEGGIVPEEFQVEYVVDRVDTTFTIWQGLTMGCARCHNHKYDSITQKDYYQVYAMFNNLAENGRAWKEGNSEPLIKAPTVSQRTELALLQDRESRALARRKVQEKGVEVGMKAWEGGNPILPSKWTVTDGLSFQLEGDDLALTEVEEADAGKFGYFDAFSFGIRVKVDDYLEGTILSRMVPELEGKGYNLHLTEKGTVQANFVQRWLDDACRVETEVSLPRGEWVHVWVNYGGTRRAEDIEIYFDGERVSHRSNYDFLNQDFRLEEPLRLGMGMADFSGRLNDVRFYDRILERDEVRVVYEESSLGEILDTPLDSRTASQRAKVLHHFLNEGGPAETLSAYRDWLEACREREAFEDALPSVMVMKDEMRRETRILDRGIYDQPGDRVEAGVPAALPPIDDDLPTNRYGLAKWLVMGENPLTARVTVNRLWRDVFGTGLVKTTEDFGVQGERPSHPELLDWLAVEFVDSGWDIQHMLRLFIESAAYQQSSRVSAKLLESDPENRLLARGPRFRLPGEMIRDQALAVSGLLHQQIGGPSVKPYQPEGLWADFASDSNYALAVGNNLYRRSLYTYWKRTVPPPMMINFDAAGREACDEAVRRTNTPLQALNLMNDVTFVEAARVFAQELIEVFTNDEAIVENAYERLLSRLPVNKEMDLLLAAKNRYLARYANDIEEAKALIHLGEYPAPKHIPPDILASWTMVCSTLMNLDETITKE